MSNENEFITERTPAEFAKDLLAYPVGSTADFSFAWLKGEEPKDENELQLKLPLARPHITRRTLSQITENIAASGFIENNKGHVVIRDMAKDASRVVPVIAKIMKELRAKRYSYATHKWERCDIYLIKVEF